MAQNGLDFGQIISAALSGGLQGYAKQRQLNAENQLAAQKIQNERAAEAAKIAPEGLGFDENGNVGYRSDFYTPGTSAYQAGTRAAQLKQAGNPRYLPEDKQIPFRALWGMQHPGQPLPSEMEQFGDMPVSPQYNAVMKQPGALANPNNQPINPDLQAGLEKKLNLPVGALNGTTQGKGLGTLGYVTGQEGQNSRQQNTLGAEADRQQKTIDAEAARQQNLLKQQKELQTGRFSTGQKATDTGFAKQYNDWTSGDRDAMADTAAQLEQVSRGLKAYKPPMGIAGLGYAAQFMPGSELGELKNQAEAATSSDLKAKFGSRVSNLDLTTGLKFTYNPKLTPEQNAAHIDNLTKVLRSRIADRDAKSDFFSGHDSSLYGYKPVRGSLYPQGQQGDAGEPGDEAPVVDRPDGKFTATTPPLGAAQGKLKAQIQQFPVPKSQKDNAGTTIAGKAKIGDKKVIAGTAYIRTKQGWEEQP
jgi:hypothetical protein